MKSVTNNLFSRRGSSLVMVLWIFVLLTTITVVVAQTSRLDTRITAAGSDKLRCKWACRAGLETAIGILNDDLPESDGPGDLWADNPEDLEDVPLEGCSFTVKVIDEAGKINVNIADQKMLMALPEMTEDVANAILDWRDSNDDEREDSVESGYYMNLPYPYQAKNKAFSTIRELLRVKGVTEELFYGPQDKTSQTYDPTSDYNIIVNQGWINYLTCYSRELNMDPEGNRRVNINSTSRDRLVQDLGITDSQARWIEQKRGNGFSSLGAFIDATGSAAQNNNRQGGPQATPLDFKTALSLIEKICIKDDQFSQGKININTASKVVLMMLFDGNENVADDIIAYRSGQAYGIETYDQLADISSLTKDVLKNTIDIMTLRSSIFTIRTTANASRTDTVLRTEAVIDRDESPVQIIYFCQGAKF